MNLNHGLKSIFTLKNKKNILLLLLMILPIVMGAESKTDDGLMVAVIMEVFCTLHVTFFLLKPLSELFCPYNISEKKFFWILFLARIIILTICDMLVSRFGTDYLK